MRTPNRLRFSRWALCAVTGGSGVLHLIVPRPYRQIVPVPIQRQAATIVVVSGICEMVCAVLLATPRWRPWGAVATTALFVAVFPANVQMALDSLKKTTPRSPTYVAAAWLRLPLQAPLILWAWSMRHAPDAG